MKKLFLTALACSWSALAAAQPPLGAEAAEAAEAAQQPVASVNTQPRVDVLGMAKE